ncbi:uncharacterized protein QC761_121940 [Podospora bellae-mahoneyi]|uniref:Zn(2)-C6 fungal-type domain-containing protein n=1 Tax=Podospora bellae-mahoneyi TaxID=2093777 RepID=A0ABR0FT00_9PEZI|nr:hypothetical protein QC761_121940 [Podospora bellae-mahoneyi]
MANNGLTQPPWFTTPVSNLNVTDEAEQSAQPKTRKRTRISVACKTCRTRKSRCDGLLPCSTCSDVGLVCEYDDPSYKPAQDKDVSQLEERLRVLEQQLAALQEKGRQNETLQATSPSASRLDDRSLQCDASTPGTSLIEDEGDVVDGMGAVSLRQDSAEQEYIAGDVLHISKELLKASETTNQNLLGAWWFSCYYTFNASLALLGVISIKRMPLPNSTILSAISTTELRKMMDTALEILHGLDGGNETITRCRDALSQMLKAVDSTGQSGTSDLVNISPSGAWVAQLMDSDLFSSELTMGVGLDMFGAGFDDAGTFFHER